MARGIITPMEKKDAQAILAANLNRLIDHETPPGGTRSVRAWAKARGLNVKLIDRLSKGENAAGIDKLTEIADACGLQPWHLLLEELQPDTTPDAPITADERKMLERLRKLLDK